MVDQPTIRQIKIKISNPEPPTEPDREYIIRWDRIIGALSVLFVLIGLLGYGLNTSLKPSILPESIEVEAHQRQDEILDGTAQQTDEAAKKAVPSPSEPAPSTSAADQQMATESRAQRIVAVDMGSDSERSSFPPAPSSERPPPQVAGPAAAGAAHRLAESTPLPAELAEQTDVKRPVSDEITGFAKMQSPVREGLPVAVTTQTPALESGGEEQRLTEQEGHGEAQPDSSASTALDTQRSATSLAPAATSTRVPPSAAKR